MQEIFEQARSLGWGGDFHTNQVASGQHWAGFGWSYRGVEDWNTKNHIVSAVICEANTGN